MLFSWRRAGQKPRRKTQTHTSGFWTETLKIETSCNFDHCPKYDDHDVGDDINDEHDGENDDADKKSVQCSYSEALY